MYYEVKYLFRFESSNGTTREIRVLKHDYAGVVIQRPLGRAPMLKKQKSGPVCGTSLEFYAECNVDGEYMEFYTSDPKEYKVELYSGSSLLWSGYITPELYNEPDIAPPYDVQVVATDGVGELKLYDFSPQGTISLRAMFTYLLGYTGVGTDVYLISSLQPGSSGAGSLLSKTICLDYMAGKTCYDVLVYLLRTLHATITWWKGSWIVARETNVTMSSGKVLYYNTAGNSALLSDSVQTLGRMRVNQVWPVGQLTTAIEPAKNKIAVQAPWHVATCLQNPDMTSDSDWAKINGADYSTDGYLLPQGSGASYIMQNLFLYGIRVPMRISVRATGLTSQITTVAVCSLAVVLTYTVGGDTYHLAKDEEGNPVWAEGSSGNIDFFQNLMVWDAPRVESEELLIDNIPAFVLNDGFPAGTLSVMIGGYGTKVYSAHLDVVLPKGYQDVLLLDNGARGAADDVEVAIGRETSEIAYYAQFLQGLLLDSGSLITSFADANFTAGMDYLSFIARDYALSVALPRAKATGTVFLESSVLLPPLVFVKGALDYWVETWGWNLYEDELEISAITLPAASLTVDSESIKESDGSVASPARSAPAGGGSSVIGAGGGSNYFEINGDLSSLVQPKQAYNYLSAKEGLFFSGGDTSTQRPDLYVDTVIDDGGHEVRVLRTPLPLFTGGDQIIGSGTPSGGGGGGMPFMRDIQDVSLSATVGNGDLLQWNGSAWVNVAANTVGVTTLASASAPGLMSSADYSKLAGIASGATNVTESTVSGWGFTKNAGTVTSVKVGNTPYNPSSGVVSLPAYPTTLPASDVYAWAKAATKPSYTLDEVTDGSTRKLSDYVLKAGDTMTGDLIISKTGGGNLIIRGTEANHDGGTLYFYGRYYSGNPRNGAKIAAVYPGSGVLYDIQDLVFYVSRNRTDATPTWEEALRIASTKDISMPGTLTIGEATIEWVPNSGNGYLRINKPLLTSGDQIVSSGTPGGGSGGGGAGYVYELGDVLTDSSKTHVKQADGTTNAANGNLFAYNGSKWYALRLGSNLAISDGVLVATDTRYTAGTGLALSNGQFSVSSAYQTNISHGQTAYGWGNHADAGYVLLATAQTISAKHTFSAGLLLNAANSWSNTDRALYFSASDEMANLRYYSTDASKGLMFNPYSGALKAGSFVKLGGGSGFLKADGSEDTTAYLPLSGGTMTGDIKMTNGEYINAESGYAMLGLGSGGSTFYCGPGNEITTSFLIRSGDINLTHVKAGTNYTIWDASNSNLSTVDWAANNLTVAGTSTFNDTMYVENRTYMYWKDSGGTSRNVFGLNNTDSLLIGYGLTSVTGSVVAIYGETVRLNTGMTELVQANGATLMLAGTGVNTGGSKILFRSSNTSDQNGFKIEAEAAASSSNRGRLALNFFTSNNTTSPYAPDWKRAMRISYNGNIMFGNTASGSEFYPTVYSYGPLQVGTSTTNKNLTVYGSITSSGDQVISSDATKKKNWRDLKYGVADIAKATAGVFDWKDGKGESAGTKAQDWMHLVPQLVHGEEGHMTLAYGQIAMLNTILLARRSEDHETRIKALELENAELRKEIERLKS